VYVIKKIIEEEDFQKASDLNSKLRFLKKLQDQENIFLDFSAETKGGLLKKKSYKFKIYYKYESTCPPYLTPSDHFEEDPYANAPY
jgi:hypothetical protein